MTRIKNLFKQIKEYIQNLPFKTYVTVFLEGIGLFANTIAIIAFFGANNTPKDSPNFYINNQEFLVWSLIAGVYTLGLSSAGIKRRWRRLQKERGVVEDHYRSYNTSIFRSDYHRDMFVREFCFTLVIVFPLTYLYNRAMMAATSEGTSSPWFSFGGALFILIPVTFAIMLASSIFDKALSLYAGD